MTDNIYAQAVDGGEGPELIDLVLAGGYVAMVVRTRSHAEGLALRAWREAESLGHPSRMIHRSGGPILEVGSGRIDYMSLDVSSAIVAEGRRFSAILWHASPTAHRDLALVQTLSMDADKTNAEHVHLHGEYGPHFF